MYLDEIVVGYRVSLKSQVSELQSALRALLAEVLTVEKDNDTGEARVEFDILRYRLKDSGAWADKLASLLKAVYQVSEVTALDILEDETDFNDLRYKINELIEDSISEGTDSIMRYRETFLGSNTEFVPASDRLDPSILESLIRDYLERSESISLL